jgi:RNA polymerase sigma-70 factor (ECF subfamily)
MMPLDLSVSKTAAEPVGRRFDGSAAAIAADAAVAAFETTYEQAWLPVFRFALAWTNDWTAAEDLAQESFLRLWRRRDEVDWGEPVLPRLLVTTRRSATDRFRRLRRGISLRAPVSTVPDSDARLEWLDLRCGFEGLSPLERSALVLTAIEDLDAAAAGAVLGIGVGRSLPKGHSSQQRRGGADDRAAATGPALPHIAHRTWARTGRRLPS